MEGIKEALLKFLKLDGVVNGVINYLESRLALVKFELREEAAHVLSRGLIILVLFLLGFLFLLFLSIGVAQYLNTYFGGPYAGYAIVASFFGLVLLVLILLRKIFFRAVEKQLVEMIKQRHH